MKKLSVIIINYGTFLMTEKVIRNFLDKEKNIDSEIILINNKSQENFDEKVFEKLGCSVIKNEENLGFARAVNQGIELATGEYVLLLNSDVFVKENSIYEMLKYLEENKGAGAVGPKMLYPDGSFQSSHGKFPSLISEFLRLSSLYSIIPGATVSSNTFFLKIDLSREKEADWVSGGCMLFRKSLIQKIGKMDEAYFLGVEDIDFCFRAKKAGFKNTYFPQSEVIHNHGGSSGDGGTRKISRIKLDRDGFDYFFFKHYLGNKISRVLVRFFHNFKIILIRYMLINKNKKKYIPMDATIAITYACNSRCLMCNIWQIENPPLLPLAALKNISPRLKYVNISGGEPFLYPDIIKIIETIKEKNNKIKIIISSNGLASDLIIEKMKKILEIDPQIGIRISIDGIGNVHNNIRRIPGIYEKAIKTIERLEKIGVKNLGISFTIMDKNAKELEKVYKLSKEKGLELALALVQNSDIYFGKKDNRINLLSDVEDGLRYVIRKELESWNIKKWGRAFYDWGLLVFAKTGKRILPSGAGFDSLFIDPSGDVYPSNLINLKMGNILDADLDEVWSSSQAEQARNKIKNENIEENWIICTIRGEMKNHLFKMGFWAAWNKLKFSLKG